MVDKAQIAQGVFNDSFKMYMILNSLCILYSIMRLVVDKMKSKNISYVRIFYLIFILIIGLVFSKVSTWLIDYNDPYINEGVGWTFLFKIIPVCIVLSVINFVVVLKLRKQQKN